MKIVIDSNIIFSSLISGKTFYIDILTQNEVFAPDFLFTEILEYENTIINNSPLKDRFCEFAQKIFNHITIIPRIAIKPETWERAYSLCKNIDEKDTPFIALSLELKIPLLTRDKKLHKGLLDKGFKDIILFDTFLEQIWV